MAEQAKCPKRVAGPPVRFVAVKNAGRFRRDAVAAAQLGEFVRLNVIANNGILQIGPPIDVNGAGNVPGVVKQNVFVRFDDANAVVFEVLRQPVGVDQRFRMRVII